MTQQKHQLIAITTEKSGLCNMKFSDGTGMDGRPEPNGDWKWAPNNDAFIYSKDEELIIQPYNLYTISDEKIKETDTYVYDEYLKQIIKLTPELFSIKHTKHYKKILATNNSNLWYLQNNGGKSIQTGIYKLPHSLQQEWVKRQGNLPEVIVEYEPDQYSAKMPINFMDYIEPSKGLPIIEGSEKVISWKLKLTPSGEIIWSLVDEETWDDVINNAETNKPNYPETFSDMKENMIHYLKQHYTVPKRK
jgi:hypothetical protein